MEVLEMYPQEKQVCSLEQAKKLDKMGVVLETTWMWWDENNMEPYVQIRVPLMSKYAKFYPAPNVAEFGILLDPYYVAFREYSFSIMKPPTLNNQDDWEIKVFKRNGITEAHARADAFIWLIDDRTIKTEDLKL